MRKKLFLLAIIICFICTLFGCSAQKLGVTYQAVTGGYMLKKFVGPTTQKEFKVPDTYQDADEKIMPVVELGEWAFATSGYVVNIELNATISKISPWSFSDCPKLQSINVPESNPYFSSVNGVLFNKEKTELLVFPNANTKNYVVPSTVKVIGENAFYKCTSLETVQLPQGLEEIKIRGFWRTTNLAPPTLPSTLTTIGADAFAFFRTESSKLFDARKVPTEIYIPASVTSIGDYAFSNCGLKVIKVGGQQNQVTVGKKWLPTKSGSVASAAEVIWGVAK